MSVFGFVEKVRGRMRDYNEIIVLFSVCLDMKKKTPFKLKGFTFFASQNPFSEALKL